MLRLVDETDAPSAGSTAITATAAQAADSPSGAADAASPTYDELRAQLDDAQRQNATLDRTLSVLVACMGGQVVVPAEVMNTGFPFGTTLAIKPLPELNLYQVTCTSFDRNGISVPVGIKINRPLVDTPQEPRTPGGIILARH